MADLDSTEVRQRTSDIKEWIFEAVDKIGAPMQYISKESGTEDVPLLKIEDYQVPIPNDMVVLDGVAYSENPTGPWTPMVTNTSVFKQPNRPPLATEPHQPMRQKAFTSQSQFYTQNLTKYAERFAAYGRLNEPEYFIKPGWIVVNRPTGFIKLAYKAIAVDERGYPLIPDLTSYQEAIYWYVVMKLSFPKFMSGKLNNSPSKYALKYSQQSYFYIQQQWNFYRNQAYAEAMMPTADDMRSIKNEWNRLIPDWEADDSFFKDINKRDHIYNDYYHGY